MPKSGAQPTFFRARPLRFSTPGAAARYSNEWLAWHHFHKLLRRRSDRLHHGTADHGPASGAHTSGVQAAGNAVGQHRLRGMHLVLVCRRTGARGIFRRWPASPGTCGTGGPGDSVLGGGLIPHRRAGRLASFRIAGVAKDCRPGSARNGLPVRHRDRIALLGGRDAWLRPRIVCRLQAGHRLQRGGCFCCLGAAFHSGALNSARRLPAVPGDRCRGVRGRRRHGD